MDFWRIAHSAIEASVIMLLLTRLGGLCIATLMLLPGLASADSLLPGHLTATGSTIACPKNKPTVWIWLSPRMPYAFTEWPRLHALILSLPNSPHIQLMRDPAVEDAEWLSAVAASKWPTPSRELALDLSSRPCGPPPTAAAAHFPTLVVAFGGKVHPWPIQGVMPSAQWATQIQQRLDSLAQANAALPRAQPAALVGFLAAPSTPASLSCIKAEEVFPIQATNPNAELGNYERISPDGRFVLRSFSGAGIGQVALIELPALGGTQLKLHPTPLKNEAFPVQGSWRFLVDVDGSHHRFSDVLLLGVRAKPLFKAGMTGFYAAATEMPGDAQSTHIRSLSWPQSDGNSALGSGDDAAIGPLQLRTVRITDEWPSSNSAHVLADTGPQYLCQQRSGQDGTVYALPMLSVDGTAFSAVPQSPRVGQPSMRSYALNPQAMAGAHTCTLRQNLGVAPSKAVFGFTQANGPPNLVYTDNAQVVLHDAALNKPFVLPPVRHQQLASAFPGATRDGRIIFAATWRDCEAGNCPQQAGYIVLDPYQNPAYQAARQAAKLPLKACIRQEEVLAERQQFADFHRIPAVGQFQP